MAPSTLPVRTFTKTVRFGKSLVAGRSGIRFDVAIKPNGAFQFSSYGFEIARAFGKNMIGNCVSDLPAADANFISKVYRLSRNKRIPCATIHTPSIGVPVGKWLRLILPLDEAGNGIVTNFLTCNVPIDITNTVR